MREHGKIESESDKFKEDKMSPLEDYNDVEYPVDEKASTVKILVNVYIKEDDVEQKKDNI
jgi:hypothetical protein